MGVSLAVMPPRSTVDAPTRERIRAWLRHYRDRREWTNQRLADELGVANATVTNILNGKRTAGLDVVLAMHKKLRRSADDILDIDPPEEP